MVKLCGELMYCGNCQKWQHYNHKMYYFKCRACGHKVKDEETWYCLIALNPTYKGLDGKILRAVKDIGPAGVTDIAREVDCCCQSVYEWMNTFEELGYVEYKDRKWRYVK